ncbi:MAG: 4-hydroxy-3-methylbut-2-enyl diphosphate reductase [Kiritimatiellaeota bacterium]|nr:4-hydroxy-3-methylbut-2-enyl diphosphate reductase [Kiritimatiellota bacterium]
MTWFDIQKDDAHVKRERAKARDLRQSAWWQQQCQAGVCHYCKQTVGADALTMDHVVPVARGGGSTKGNIVPCCNDCNSKKSLKTPAEQILDQLFPKKTLRIADPHGFCSGVARAIRMAESALTACGHSCPRPAQQSEHIYCLNEIVHNQHVVAQLTAQGMKFVRRLEDIPEGARILFSAHGVSPAVRVAAARRGLRVIDATCPFVEKVHAEVRRFVATEATIICIGHRNHEEVIGVAGEAPDRTIVVENAQEVEALDIPPEHPIAVVTQTTLGATQVDAVMDALRKRFTTIASPPHSDICYATRDRQNAVRELAKRCDCVIVLGSANSSNSQRLAETAREGGGTAILISEMTDLDRHDWAPFRTLGITSGASTPEAFLDEVVEALVTRFHFSLFIEPVHTVEGT